jgi:hypothetical protein
MSDPTNRANDRDYKFDWIDVSLWSTKHSRNRQGFRGAKLPAFAYTDRRFVRLLLRAATARA